MPSGYKHIPLNLTAVPEASTQELPECLITPSARLRPSPYYKSTLADRVCVGQFKYEPLCNRNGVVGGTPIDLPLIAPA